MCGAKQQEITRPRPSNGLGTKQKLCNLKGNTVPEEKKYKGYANYATWLCATWLSVDQRQREMMRDKAKEIAADLREPQLSPDSKRYKKAVAAMAAYIEQLVYNWPGFYKSQGALIFSDFVNTAFRGVNYRDIAETLLDGFPKGELRDPAYADWWSVIKQLEDQLHLCKSRSDVKIVFDENIRQIGKIYMAPAPIIAYWHSVMAFVNERFGSFVNEQFGLKAVKTPKENKS
jgi:hypothetical protein